jgi:hypothetical protein
MNFELIFCQFEIGSNLRAANVFPCPNLQIQNEECQLMTILLRFPNEPVFCEACSKLSRKVSDDVAIRPRTAPDSRVPCNHLMINELYEKVNRLKKERQNLLKRINYVKVSSAKKKLQKVDLPFSDLAENWQRPLENAMAWFRKQSTYIIKIKLLYCISTSVLKLHLMPLKSHPCVTLNHSKYSCPGS